MSHIVPSTAFGRERTIRTFVAAILAILASLGPANSSLVFAQNAAPPPQEVIPHWDPKEGAPPGAQFAGSATCAACHVSEAITQAKTPMGQAAQSAADCEILRQHPILNFQLGPYRYEVTRKGNQSIYTVFEGAEKVSVPILWAFGMGEAGQTYLLEKDGAYCESKVSFFNDVQKLDVTLGNPPEPPTTLDGAFGKRLQADDAALCISCHTTGAVALHLNTMSLGVGCEACHGPGGQHVAAMKSGHTESSSIFNPGKLAAGDLDEFCGSCHRTWSNVQLMHLKGVVNVRFQPYRLENSRCWSSDDARISCLACHNPHEPLQRNAAYYDSKCLSCQLRRGATPAANHPGKACPVDSKNCIPYHMPKYELPGGHFQFIDHQIRVVRAGETFPN